MTVILVLAESRVMAALAGPHAARKTGSAETGKITLLASMFRMSHPGRVKSVAARGVRSPSEVAEQSAPPGQTVKTQRLIVSPGPRVSLAVRGNEMHAKSTHITRFARRPAIDMSGVRRRVAQARPHQKTRARRRCWPAWAFVADTARRADILSLTPIRQRLEGVIRTGYRLDEAQAKTATASRAIGRC